MDEFFWLNYCRKSYIFPKTPRCIYKRGLGKILWLNTGGYIVGVFINTHCAWAGGIFFPVVVLCQFLVLAGNRFWFYIIMYLEYNTVVVLC